MRMQLMVEALAQAVGEAGKRGNSDGVAPEAADIARALEAVSVSLAGQSGSMRASDHQFQQPLVVGVMERQGAPGVKFDVEGSGYGFKVIKTLSAAQARMPESCTMQRPAP
jgi:branched-chain amino acid transport system substrate-binding protein